MSNDTTTNTEETTTLPTEKVKRTRLSPRVKFAEEVIAMMSEHLSDLQEERKETDVGDLTNITELDAKIALVSDLSGKVQSLVDEGNSKGEYSGRHYVGKLASDGSLVAFDSNTTPTKRSHGPETKHGFSTVWGPQRTKEGRAYRMARPEVLDETKPVF
jgi:hypothetical protein